MTGFYLYDDAQSRRFEPFALTRPTGELRAGSALIRERWETALGVPCVGYLCAQHLANFSENGVPPAATNGRLVAGTIIVNARALPPLAPLRSADVWRIGERIAAVRLGQPTEVERFADGDVSLNALSLPTARLRDCEGWWLDHVWDLLRHLGDMLRADISVVAPSIERGAHSGVIVSGTHELIVEEGATLEALVYADTTAGPILVRRGASVSAFTRLVGPCVIGANSQVLGGKVTGVSIGEHCRVHGELSTSIFVGHANKGHDGFVGHSILGRWVNLGASTVTSNLKNTYGAVQLWTPQGIRDSGMQFLGSFIGDHAKTAIGTRLTTGCVVGAGANVVADGLTPKVIEPFAWGDGTSVYDLSRFLIVAERVMARRHVMLTERGRQHLADAYAARWVAAV